jgi:hypothetical protein
MNLTIRIIGIATTFLWIFLAIFLASTAYSVKDLHFDFGKPQICLTSENRLLLCLPISIANKGYYDLSTFNITTQMLDFGKTIAKGTTLVPHIGKGENLTINHNMTFEINQLLQHSHDCLFNDSQLLAMAFASMRLADLITAGASANLSFSWGAPFYNFTLGEPIYERFNGTHLKIVLPISFENHASFDFAGEIGVKMYNSSGILIGEGQTPFETPQCAFYSGYAEFYVSIAEFTSKGVFEVYFLTPVFNYGPLVIPFG